MQLKRHFTTIDAHTGGEPLRLITGGLPPLPGATILERRRYMKEHLDDVRQILMYEPRGHHGMYGAILTPPVTEDADLGVLFMHNEGYSTMCGHGIIALVTIALETGMLRKEGPEPRVTFDTPAGKVYAQAVVKGDRVEHVRFKNVPSFVYQAGVELPDGVKADIVFGGAFYAFVRAEDCGLRVRPDQVPQLQAKMTEYKAFIEANYDVHHPDEPELKEIYGVIFYDKPDQPGADWRNVCVFADQQIDRSPCGTGTAARLAHLHHLGEMKVGDSFIHESIVGSKFTGRILGETTVGPFKAIIPEVGGSASITGFHQFVVDEGDPLGDGFLLR
ncbi:MAG TPA: proline racemase family protein [Symbiobacteriaceae bacterium]|nr:proline racemase family protein [Symbiobacteriaceae bacterium]